MARDSGESSAYAAALGAAQMDHEAYELVATALTSLIAGALEANGFRRRGELPVFVHDPRGLLNANSIHASLGRCPPRPSE
jgi:hypothetical protein